MPEIDTLCDTRNAIRQKGWKTFLDLAEPMAATIAQWPLIENNHPSHGPEIRICADGLHSEDGEEMQSITGRQNGLPLSIWQGEPPHKQNEGRLIE